MFAPLVSVFVTFSSLLRPSFSTAVSKLVIIIPQLKHLVNALIKKGQSRGFALFNNIKTYLLSKAYMWNLHTFLPKQGNASSYIEDFYLQTNQAQVTNLCGLL